MTPKGAASNGTSFSSGECGAWSVAIAAIVPSRKRVDQGPRSSSLRSGGFIFMFASSVRIASSVRQRWCGVASAVACPRRVRATEVVDRFAGREVHQVHRLLRLAGEVEVARDHQALAERRPAAETELGRDEAGVRVATAREGCLFAVHGDHPARDGVVLKRAPHHTGRRDGPPVVGEAGGTGGGERGHLGELRSVLTLRDRGQEADRNARLLLCARTQPAQDVRVVDHRVGVRHGEDRAVAAGGGRCGAARDRLLVFAARRAQMDVRVDERRCEREARRLDHAMLVRVEALAELCDHAVVDAHIDRRVDPFDRVEHTRATHDDVLCPGPSREHHATSTVVSTATGPVVSRS